MAAVNDAPTLTSVATLQEFTEDTYKEITYATLASAADDADVDGNSLSFKITTINSGSLQKWNGSNWTDATSDTTLAVNEKLQWKADLNANGQLDAFKVQAYDGAVSSGTDVQVKASVAAVNDAPLFSSMSGAVDTVSEDTTVAISFAELLDKATIGSVDGLSNDAVNAFVIQSISSGTLKIGTSAANALDFNATTNNTVNNTVNLYWTPAANANGTLDAFTMLAKDNGGLMSSGAVQVQVTVNAVNDAPILTAGAPSATLVEASGVSNNTLGTAGASIQLTKSDVDSAVTYDTTYLMNGAWSTTDTGVTYTKQGTYGKATFTVASGVVSYALDNTKAATQALNAASTVTDSFTVQVTDGTATALSTASFSIQGANDAPVLTTPSVNNLSDSSAVDAFANVTSTLSATDPEAASLTYTLNGTTSGENYTIGGVTYTRKQLGSYGVLYFLPTTAAYVYAPNATPINGLASGASVTDSFVFSVSDGVLTDTQTLTVNLTGANDYATVTNNAIRVNMGTSIPTSVSSLNTSITSRTLVLSDFGLSDAESNTSAAIQFTSLPVLGSLTLNGAAVVANQTVSWTDIVSGNLSYLTGNTPSGSSYATIGFKVQDGVYTSSVKALTLNGTTEYLDVGALTAANNKQISNQVTLEAWVKFSALETHARIFDLSSGASTNNIILTQNYFRIHNGGTSTGDAYFSITTGQWSHVAAIIDGTAMSVYINGELVGSGTLFGGQTLDRSSLPTPLSNDRTQNWIGRSAWGDPFADLSVYDARIYNDVRTQAEILQDMHGLTTANDPNLLKRLTLDGTTDGLGGATRAVSSGTLPSANYTDYPNTLVVHVDAQAVSLTGTANAETLAAAAGNDSVQGLAGNDVLWGVAGNDTLNGGNGNDTMNGQAGYDLLIGGPGSDTMTGELQADTFQWLAGDAFDPSTAAVPVVGGVTTPYTDTVNDFTLLQGDKIDLKGLLADTFQNHGLNASNISTQIANYVNLSQSGTSTTALIKVDLDGAGNFDSPELTISLTTAWAANNLYSTWTVQSLMNSKVLVVL